MIISLKNKGTKIEIFLENKGRAEEISFFSWQLKLQMRSFVNNGNDYQLDYVCYKVTVPEERGEEMCHNPDYRDDHQGDDQGDE